MSGNLFPGDLPILSLAEMAGRVAAWIEGHRSLRLGNGNRIETLCSRVVRSVGRVVGPEERNHPALVQAFKDVQELWLIVQVLGDRLAEPPFAQRLRFTARDTLLSTDADDETPGRDTQFELFLAAACLRAGMLVEEFEPISADWKITVPATRYSLEAKRAKSIGGLEDRVRGAAHQITRSGVGGLVVVDFSEAVWPGQHRLDEYVTDDRLKAARDARGNWFVQNWLPRIRQWIEGAPVGVVVLHDHVIRPAASTPEGEIPWGLFGSWDWIHFTAEGSSQRARYAEFQSLFSACLPNW